jgi:hypothetical protein
MWTWTYILCEDFCILECKAVQCTLEMEVVRVSETLGPIYQSHGITYQKTVIFIVTAVKTSNLLMIDALSVENSQYPVNPPINQHFIRILKDTGFLLASCICVNLSFAPNQTSIWYKIFHWLSSHFFRTIQHRNASHFGDTFQLRVPIWRPRKHIRLNNNFVSMKCLVCRD